MKRSAPQNRQVFAHFLTWFRTRNFSGEWQMWNSDYEQSPHNPETMFANGQRDAAVTSYPLIGLYDSTDPHVIEFQLLLMNAAGIDGVIIDWDGRRLNPYRHDALAKLLPYLRRFGMRIIVCFEEWCGYWPKGQFASREDELRAASGEMRWLLEKVVTLPEYAVIEGKKPILVFRKIMDQWFSPAEWSRLAGPVHAAGATLLFDDAADKSLDKAGDGRFYWLCRLFGAKAWSNLEDGTTLYEQFCSGGEANTIAGVAPGFDDTPVWGWGEVPRNAPRYDGERYRRMWEMSIEAGAPAVQIITWNDWNEGTQIEPCDKWAFQYVEATRKFAAQFKGCQPEYPEQAQQMILRLFNARKSGGARSAELDEISRLLTSGKVSDAEKMLSAFSDEDKLATVRG